MTDISDATLEKIVQRVIDGLRDFVVIGQAALTPAEAGKRLNVSARTIRDLVAAGKIRAEYIGTGRGTIRIRPEDLEAYREEARGTPTLTSTSAKRLRHLGL